MSKKYKTKSGAIQFIPSIEEVESMASEMEGFCLGCGAIQSGCEPDARRYICEACDQPKVYGASELAIMGLIY